MTNQKVLHLTHDDKFIDAFIRKTQSLGYLNHEFFIYSRDLYSSLKFIKDTSIHRISLSDLNDGKLVIAQYAKVYIHYFSDDLVDFVSQYGDKTTFVWVFWGADAFDLPCFKTNYWTNNTKKIVSRISNKTNNFRCFFSGIKQKFILAKKAKKKKRASKQFSYFAHYIQEDFNLIKKQLGCNFKYINFTYGTLSDFTSSDVSRTTKKNILIGNSANPSNNHVDIIHQLNKQQNIKDAIIYCPLSYSGTSEYIKEIKNEGELLFPNQFIAMEGFMKLQEYNKIIASIACAFMPHLRSQAFGNIINLLWQGAKIFFYSDNSLYKLLKQKGIHVFEINDSISFVPLTKAEIEKNKSNLNEFIGEDATIFNYNQLLNI